MPDQVATITDRGSRFFGWKYLPDFYGRMGWERPDVAEADRWWAHPSPGEKKWLRTIPPGRALDRALRTR